MSLAFSLLMWKPFEFAASQMTGQEADIIRLNAKGGSMGNVWGVTAEDTVLDQYICPPVLNLLVAG
jgi:hypothetical protein